MDEKVLKIFEKINFTNYECFENASFLRTINNNGEFTFVLSIDSILDDEIYTELTKNSLENGYKLLFEVRDIDYNVIGNYVNLFNENYSFELNNSTVIFKPNSMSEHRDLLDIKDNLLKFLKEVGFKDASINISAFKDKTVVYGGLINATATPISNLTFESENIVTTGYVYSADFFESPKSSFKLITLLITDDNDSIYGKIFCRDKYSFDEIKESIKIGNYYSFKGNLKEDSYLGELALNISDINNIETIKKEVKDNEEVKRVELHAHTNMSSMDSQVNVKDLIKYAKKLGHRAVAITDHNTVQSFPDAFHSKEDIKIIYGCEMSVIDDNLKIVTNPRDYDYETTEIVVFDTETTGFNATGSDQMIEIGAVKILNGKIIDEFNMLIDPKRDLPEKITNITGITSEMLVGNPSEEEVTIKFLEFSKGCVLCAHNAAFDMSFLNSSIDKYNIETEKFTVIDTLILSRVIDNGEKRHSLSNLVKRYKVEFDENAHHRASYDARKTAEVFIKMMDKLLNQNITNIGSFNKLITEDNIAYLSYEYHVTMLVKNNEGLKNLFELVSLSSTKYLNKTPVITREEIIKHKEGLLIGSSCSNGEIFMEASSKSEEELADMMEFYDYIEIQPRDVYSYLIDTSKFENMDELTNNITNIINIAEDKGKLIVATGDVHHLKKEDKIYREIIVNQRIPVIGRHPLKRDSIKEIPSQHFRTTEEMINDFMYLGREKAYEYVVLNTNKLTDMIEDDIVVIKDSEKPFSPVMENSKEEVRTKTYDTARKIYGDKLPEHIESRIETELGGIINGGFDVIYLIAHKLVEKSLKDGYIVGSRGSVGSSVVAYLLGITEVNPLPSHYICESCKKSLFEDEEGNKYTLKYKCGNDLPDKICSCGKAFKKDGHDIPFATFLGFNADKVPDIDLNFSSIYQPVIHNYTKELFGEKNVFRAGTISTASDKTAFGFSLGYFEDRGIKKRRAHITRLSKELIGVKRTTGQHPGGIVVVPSYTSVFDFTPYQYPADDKQSSWYTTHFDYHAIDKDLLKLDLLGHVDPTHIKMLCDLTGINVFDIPLDDTDVISLFNSPSKLGVSETDINAQTGTLGIPEFGTNTAIRMLVDIRPKTFADIVKVSGLAHGTDVWNGNARDLVINKVCTFDEVIGCRDDIMVYLMEKGLDASTSFKIMEFVRKGLATKVPDVWKTYEDILKENNIAPWYIESCRRIKYMFPKAHATAYVTMAYRVAYFKLYKKLEYYASYFSVRESDFDVVSMKNGLDAVNSKMNFLEQKGFEKTARDNNVLSSLAIAREALNRGVNFGNIDLYKSDSFNFVIDYDTNTLIPPFRAIDGLGDAVASAIILEREKGKFISIDDLKVRCKISATVIEKLRDLGVLNNMSETNQLTLSFF